MKFWELRSICFKEKDVFMKILSQEKWKKYYEYELNAVHYIDSGKRAPLDSKVPEELCLAVFSQIKMKFHLTDYGVLRMHQEDPHPDVPNEGETLSALETYKRYGDFYMEEAIEKGGVRLSFGIPKSYTASDTKP